MHKIMISNSNVISTADVERKRKIRLVNGMHEIC